MAQKHTNKANHFRKLPNVLKLSPKKKPKITLVTDVTADVFFITKRICTAEVEKIESRSAKRKKFSRIFALVKKL